MDRRAVSWADGMIQAGISSSSCAVMMQGIAAGWKKGYQASRAICLAARFPARLKQKIDVGNPGCSAAVWSAHQNSCGWLSMRRTSTVIIS